MIRYRAEASFERGVVDGTMKFMAAAILLGVRAVEEMGSDLSVFVSTIDTPGLLTRPGVGGSCSGGPGEGVPTRQALSYLSLAWRNGVLPRQVPTNHLEFYPNNIGEVHDDIGKLTLLT